MVTPPPTADLDSDYEKIDIRPNGTKERDRRFQRKPRRHLHKKKKRPRL